MSAAIGLDPVRLKAIYERDAERYCSSLPLEHFMESIYQSRQREITLESFALVRAVWPEFQVFSELLIQFLVPGQEAEKPSRVVPDNMVIVHPEPVDAEGSFMAPLHETVHPTLVMEYLSKGNKRKDYEDSFQKYEQGLKVPYYLLFDPDHQVLKVFHLVDEQYALLSQNALGRISIPELELEVGILDRWVRFWFRGELLPLPGDLLNSLNAEREARIAAEESAAVAEKAAATAEKAAATAQKSLSEERTARLAAEAELARMREELARATRPPAN